MIKKIIFPLAITLSLTNHHAVGMDKDDDESLDAPTISAKLTMCNAALEYWRKECAELYKKYYSSRAGFSHDSGSELIIDGSQMEYRFWLGEKRSPLAQAEDRMAELYIQKQELEALLKKVEEQAPTS
ncbi:MAG: hypothetical protein K2X02_09325 [Alphaproteobacteria bacterium]|nr:hypothetical protein [Alphaproteobacteria bacterium]